MGDMLEEEPISYLKPPKLRHDYLLGLVFVLMAFILLVGWLPNIFYFNLHSEAFLTIHLMLMFFSVVVSFTVFVVAWYDYKQTGSIRELIICLTFLLVGCIDVAHTLSYNGFPDFFTPNSLNKSTTFWVFSRIVESVGLCLAVITNPLNKIKVSAPRALFFTTLFAIVFVCSIAYDVPNYPEMFDPVLGQTKAKVFLDYVIILTKGFALYHLIKMRRNFLADFYLQAALIFGIFSEAAFTLYASAFDTFNMLGHIYKIFEFGYIMKALFVLSLVRLYQTNTVLHHQKKRMAEINIKLEKANQLKNEYLTNTNHELRTPLTAIIAFTELLLDRQTGPLNNLQKDYINEINESGQQLLNYINNLLDLSKIEAGKMELHLELTSLEEIFRNIFRRTEPIFMMKNQTLVMKLEEGIPNLYLDPPKIMQVITNLLSNAHKFSPEGSKVFLEAKLDSNGKKVVISVADEGIGISKENQEVIFEKFRQVNEVPTTVHPGTGLGLALVRHLVHLHGGKVTVESKLGLGSTFYFYIPLGEEEVR